MISYGGAIMCILLAVFLVGFIDLFVKERNRCEMTYMYQTPEYVKINFHKNLAKVYPNYNLYVYGEGQYADTLRLNEFNGNPIVFVPGNGGNFKQVRSLASIGLLMSFRRSSHLNYFTIDYNEELSAFIGDKLEYQAKYLFHSIRKILELYNHVPNIRIILVGHSIGGIVIRSLLTKQFFKPFLNKISVVITLAAPHLHPAIIYDMKTLNFYQQLNHDYKNFRENQLSHINFISIGGSHQDVQIRSDLIDLNSNYPFDKSILTTGLNDVWVSADHLCIVWCRQLLIKINRMLFDLIDQGTSVFHDSANKRQKIINYHLFQRYLSQEYPDFPISNLTTFPTMKLEWMELKDRLVRLNYNKIIQPINYLIRLKHGESIVIHIQGDLKPNTISVCKIQQIDGKFSCVNDALILYDRMQLVPLSPNNKIDRHLGNFEAEELLRQGFSHLIIHLSPPQSGYQVIIDRFTTYLRVRKVNLPNLPKALLPSRSLFEPQHIFSKLISQEQVYFELSLANFDNIWDSYWFLMQTTSCYQNNASFSGFIHLIHPDQPQMNEYYWPFQYRKGSQYQFSLLRHKSIIGTQTNSKLLLYLEPNCSFDLLVKFSITSSIAQLLKHYFTIIVPMMISNMILILCVQFSNICNRFTFSNNDLERFKNNFKHHEHNTNSKCYMFLNASEVMINYPYFGFCLVQIVPASLLTTAIIGSFFPDHDLVNMNRLTIGIRCLICTILFLFSYSTNYILIIFINHLLNNFADGVVFFKFRSNKIKLNFGVIGRVIGRWIQSAKSKLFFLIKLVFLYAIIYSFIYLMPLTFSLIHFMFTLMMLSGFLKAKSLEFRIGKTSSISLIYGLYPIIFCLFLAMTLLQLPLGLDWIYSFKSTNRNVLKHIQTIFIIHIRNILLLIPLLSVVYFIYTKPLCLETRLKSFKLNRTQRFLNILLLVVSLANIILGTLAFEYLSLAISATFLIIFVHLRIVSNNINNIKDNIKSD